jgi:hypothetical protein
MDDLMSVNGGIGRVRAVCWCVHCGRLDYVVRNLDGDVVGRLADPLLPSRQ